MGQKQKRIRQKERKDSAKEQKRRYIEKWDETNSPENPDREETGNACCQFDFLVSAGWFDWCQIGSLIVGTLWGGIPATQTVFFGGEKAGAVVC